MTPMRRDRCVSRKDTFPSDKSCGAYVGADCGSGFDLGRSGVRVSCQVEVADEYVRELI